MNSSPMSVLSDADIIAKNQIGNGLDTFRRLSRAKCEDLGISEVRQLVETSGPGKPKQPLANSKLICVGARDLALELILALQSIPLTRALPSRIGRGTLLRDLSNLVSQIDSGEFDIGLIIPLFEKVDSRASDLEICNALFALVARPATPPRPLPYSDQTPLLRNTSSFVNSSEHRKYVDNVLKEELGPLYVGIPGFYEVFFREIAGLKAVAEAGFKKCKDGNNLLYREAGG
jgi:hypothetical protein